MHNFCLGAMVSDPKRAENNFLIQYTQLILIVRLTATQSLL